MSWEAEAWARRQRIGGGERQRDFIHVNEAQTPRERMQRVLATVSREHFVEPADILGVTRRSDAAQARFHCWHQLRSEGLSYPQIARMFRRHHATVIHGVRRWEGRA